MRDQPDRRNRHPKSSQSNSSNAQARQTTISKSLTLILRHRASQERIPMSSDGYVRCDHMLNWHRLKSMGVGLQEMLTVVQEDRLHGKGRFGLLYQPNGKLEEKEQQAVSSKATTDESSQEHTADDTSMSTSNDTDVALSMSACENPDLDPTHYFIRATQGHSLKLANTETLLTPITLDDSSTIPDTVVHGTFYGAWPRILHSGGLKSMSRTHVHFATGPNLHEMMSQQTTEAEDNGHMVKSVERSLVENKVRSGMRSDAQILIYIDIRRALQAGVKFWRSENGVVLSSAEADRAPREGLIDRDDSARQTLVPVEFFEVVIEIKRGIGVLWQDGKVVKELPDHLVKMALPRGKGDGGKTGGKNDAKGPGATKKGRAKDKSKVTADMDDGIC